MNFTGCSVLILDKSTKKLNVSKVTKEVRRVFGFQSSKIHLRILNSFKFKNTYGLLALPGFLSVWLNRDGFKHILSICLNSDTASFSSIKGKYIHVYTRKMLNCVFLCCSFFFIYKMYFTISNLWKYLFSFHVH